MDTTTLKTAFDAPFPCSRHGDDPVDWRHRVSDTRCGVFGRLDERHVVHDRAKARDCRRMCVATSDISARAVPSGGLQASARRDAPWEL